MNAEPAQTIREAPDRESPGEVSVSEDDGAPADGGESWTPARLWRALTRPRGNRLWDGVVRGSGILGLLGIALVALVPETSPLVGFSIFTIWMTGPLSPLFPTGYEPVLMVMSRVYAPLLVAAVGMVTQIYVEFLNYHLHRRLLALDAAESLRESTVVRKLQGYFERHPFFTVWFCAWSPIPYWTVRVLAPLSGYPVGRYMAATILGRFPKLWIFAALGLYWQAPSDALLLGVAGGSMVLGAAAWGYRRWGRHEDTETPASWRVDGGGDPAGNGRRDGGNGGAPRVANEGAGGERQAHRDRPAKVLYIAGIGRSGSTLVARALGGAEGLTAVGEAMHFFGRGLTNNELCACGRPVRQCPLWGRVAERLTESGGPLPTSGIERLRHRATEGRHLPALLSPIRTPGFDRKLADYRDHLSRLYRELRRVSGGRVIVDSSKNAGYARVLREAPGVELHLVHLVRDSRGVAHSLRKRTRRPGVRWSNGDELLDRRGAGTAAVFWSAAQLLVESLGPTASGYVRVRYRDFVRSPRETLRKLLRDVGEFRGPRQLAHVRDGALELDSQHILAGNPMRDQRGAVVLEEDLEWRRQLGTVRRGVVTALTLPLLRRYGYVPADDGEGRDESEDRLPRSVPAHAGRAE